MASFSLQAMRCGTSLVNEGDNVARMVALCGEPTYNYGQSIGYINKDGHGMDYFIHTDANGVIDNITFNRG